MLRKVQRTFSGDWASKKREWQNLTKSTRDVAELERRWESCLAVQTNHVKGDPNSNSRLPPSLFDLSLTLFN